MDITKMTIEELKVLAYDTITKLEQAQIDLGAINKMIVAKKNEVVDEKPKEEKGNEVVDKKPKEEKEK